MNDIKTLESRARAFKTTLQFISEKKLADKYPALIPVVESLCKKLDKIRKLNLLAKPGRNSNLKKGFRRQLAAAAYHVSCGVYAYAQITGNASLKNAVHYSFSDFYRPLESTMLGRCRQVMSAVRRIKNPEQFAIMPEVIKKLEDQIAIYTDFMSVPKGEVKRHANAMRVAKTLLDQCFSIVQKQLEPLIVIINCSEPGILSGYKICRRVHTPAGRRRKYVKSGKYKKNKKQSPVVIPVSLNMRGRLVAN